MNDSKPTANIQIRNRHAITVTENAMRDFGDRNLAEAAERLILAGANAQRSPSNPPEGQGVGINAAPTPSATQPT